MRCMYPCGHRYNGGRCTDSAVYFYIIKEKDLQWIPEVLLCEYHLKCIAPVHLKGFKRDYNLLTLEEYIVHRVMNR